MKKRVRFVKTTWFKESKITDICEVELLHDSHLHWPQLNVDLEIEASTIRENIH